MSNGLNAYQFALPLNDLGSGQVNLVPTRAGDPTPTFTRATTRTTISSAGLVIPVSSGVAASYYDPTTLQYMGYVAEGQRTNLLLRSEEFDNAAWTKTDTTITADNTTSPDGTANADLLTTGVAGTQNVAQNVTATADVSYSVSVFVKMGNTRWFNISFNNGANIVRGFFDLQNGVVGSTTVGGTGASATIQMKGYPNGWYRCILNGIVGSGATTITILLRMATADGDPTPVNNSTRYQWGAQFENNATFASTYIPTAGSTVTRNADVLTYPFAGNANAAAGTCYAETSTQWSANSSSALIATSGAAEWVLGTGPSATPNQLSTAISIRDGTSTITKSGLSDMATATRKRISSWGAAGLSVSGDGVTPQTGAFDGSEGSAGIGIGCRTSGDIQWFGTIKNVAIWQQQLSDAQLQALTA